MNNLLEFDRHALLAGQWWRLWTGHLVHYTPQHALIDFAVVLAAAVIVVQLSATPAIGMRRLALALGWGAPFISVGMLLIAPACLTYRGASGIASMLVVMAGGALWPRAARSVRAALVLMAATLLAKIGAEAAGYAHGLSDLPADVVVAWQAHLLGVVAGAITFAVRKPRLQLD
ncbi:rhombosortase [Rugamonas aquatica]|uniref:Rhombosortase n=1 Tax=Rugamonas aquatica TaxID=2743357 RepID=A0A6A7N757_9BURK|nr:rhombosortase [Rugamonas aquatica]MQA40923.1 rhombosortase [Rugamonas aquatica]